jgi:hypothetical protein
MEKICIFCGRNPQAKNREHVLPRWLIKATGDPKRQVQFGYQRRYGDAPRVFSYDSFAFPSCKVCNDTFSQMEHDVRPLVLSLLARETLSALDFHHLLNWFDKVRIGLWLAFYYLDRNLGNIEPKFHISSRIATADRMLFIIRMDDNKEELSFRGCDTPSFYYTPSCFSIIINNVALINISSPFFLARRLGFPYPKRARLLPSGLTDFEIHSGRERIMWPTISRTFRFEGVSIL